MKRRRDKKSKIIFFTGALVVFVAIALFSYPGESYTEVPHQNNGDLQISLHQNRPHIKSVMELNSEFKHLAFTDLPKERSWMQSQVASVLKSAKSFSSRFTLEKPKEKEHGSWLWTPTLQMTDSYMKSVLDDAQKNAVNVMYLSIDSYLDIFTMPKGVLRENKKAEFTKKVATFIRLANERGIEVDAEAGWQNWAEEGHEYKGFAIVNFVKNFNLSNQEKFRGFQYDVEPYLLSEFTENPEAVLERFVSLIDKTEQFLGDSDLTFSVVVPDFFDEKDKMTPKFSYNGSRKFSTLEHLFNILDRREDSSIIVMSYRNFALGKDGSIEVTQNEINTAHKGRYSTHIIVAQETGDVPPPYITFHNTSKETLEIETAKIEQAFSSSPNFGGLAIHYINAYLDLK